MKHRKLSKAEKRDLRDSTALLISALSLGVSVMALANMKSIKGRFAAQTLIVVHKTNK